MDYCFTRSLASLSCLLTVSLLAMGTLSATDADHTASALAERGGGGRGGGHFEGSHPQVESHSNYHPQSSYHPNVDHYNHDTYNHGTYNEFDRNAWNRNAWDAAEWGAGGLDAVPEGEYVYPGNTQYTYPYGSPTSSDMNTLYDSESSTNQTSPN